MKKTIFLLLLIILLSSSTLALERRGDVIGAGTISNPYRFEDNSFGVLEDCSVVVFNPNSELWETDLTIDLGEGTIDSPYRMADGSYGIVCTPGSYVSTVSIGAPVQRGEGSATITPGSPPTSTPISTAIGCDEQRCLEIDEVWQKIQGLLQKSKPEAKTSFWDVITGWTSFERLHPGRGTSIDVQDVKQAAQAILDSPNVRFWDGLSTGSDRKAFEDLARTGQTIVPATRETVTPNLQMMKALVEMANAGPIMINALTGGTHSGGSSHYRGLAVDLDIRTGNAAQIEAIARKYGGTRNSETNHIHLDFPKVSISENQQSSQFCVATEGTSYQRALLDTIAWAEGTNEKYNVMFGGSTFSNYNAHPVITGEMPVGGITKSGITSTAAGRYQFLKGTYDDLKNRVGGYFPDFSPREQDRAALYIIASTGMGSGEVERYANQGQFTVIWNALKNSWTSLNIKSSSDLERIFQTCLNAQ